MILEVRHLRFLQAIGATGSVTGAAARVHLTQPGLSHALRDLEKRLGVRLFRRERTHMAPTAACQRLLHVAEVVLEEVALAERDLQSFRAGMRGVVRLAIQCYTCYQWLPAVMHGLRATLPHVDVQVVPEAAEVPLAHLERGSIDVAIVPSDSSSADVVSHELLANDEIIAVLARDHPLSRNGFLRPQDLVAEHVILHCSRERRLALDAFATAAGVEPARLSMTPLTETVMAMVAHGIGLTLVPRWVAASRLADRSVVGLRLGTEGVFKSWYAVTRKEPKPLPFVASVVDLIRAGRLGRSDGSTPRLLW